MNKKFFVIMIMFAVLLAIGLIAMPNSNVQAQAGGPGCVDAAGAPCTATPEPSTGGGGSDDSGGGGSGGGNRNPTSTPLPITNPTQGVDTAGATWSGTCKGATIQATTTCIGQFTNGCSHVGGSTSSTVNTDGSVDLTCTVPLILEPTPMPLVNPTSDGELEGSITCAGGADASWMLSCIQNLVNSCGGAGGVSTIDPPDSAGGVTVNCSVDYLIIDPTLPLVSVPPTPTPLPDENYLGSCSNADGDVFDCFDRYTCEDGLMVIKVDLYAPGGTKYDFYCIPDKDVPQLDLPLSMPEQVGEDNNWTGGCSGGAGLEACLDLMAAGCADDGGEFSVWYDDDGAGVYCQNQSEAVLPASTPAPAIVDAPSGGGGGPWIAGGVIGFLIGMLVPAIQKVRNAAAKGESSGKGNTPPPPPPPPPPPANSSDLATWQANYGTSASQSKPKPKPTPPPSKPKPSGGPKGDINSDGSVDGSDFNPWN